MQRLFIFMILATMTAMPRAGQAATLKVCYDQWAPMTIFPSDGAPKRGVVIDMVDQIYSSHGYELEYYEVPLARGLSMVADGLCDMLPEYVFSATAEKGFVYADEKTFAYITAFVVRRDDPWLYNGIQSLQGRRIATGPGWDYSSASLAYQSYIDDPRNSDFIEVISGYDDVVDRIFTMIKENRVDQYADNELVLQYVLNQLNLNDDLKIIRPGLETKLVERPIFSTKMPDAKRQDLIKIWDEGRVALSGAAEKALLDKYGVTFKD
ncbi:transporter substrate-binding domain-containing protein [Thalassospira sp.]|uniref:substrate-binding periplasmic protein n=1 Tax=Thalassospira sp. TaxID=1912094 RepID=UPI0032F0214E